MTRIEIIEKMNELERRRLVFKAALNDMNDYYHKTSTISLYIETSAHRREYKNEEMLVDNEIFKDYLDNELTILEGKITECIDKLTQLERPS